MLFILDNRCLDAVKVVAKAPSSDLSPSSKYFLCKIIWLHGSRVVESDLGQLQGELGLSRNAIVSARNSLFEGGGRTSWGGGYLVEESIPGKSGRTCGRVLKGRPRKGVRLHPGFADWLVEEQSRMLSRQSQRLTFNDTVLQRLIDDGSCQRSHIVKSRKVPDREAMATSLTWDNRYLLFLLWSLADHSGVISDVGVSRIAKMACMTKDQVEGQLSKLHRLEYIRHQVGGVSSSHLFGRKAGVVFLNAKHPSFANLEGGGNWVSFLLPAGDGALADLEQAFYRANKIGDAYARFNQAKERLNAGEQSGSQQDPSAISPDDADTVDDLYLERLRNRIQVREQEFTALAGEFEKAVCGLRSNVSEEASGANPIGLYEAFLKSNRGVRRFAEMIVCRYASELLCLNNALDAMDAAILAAIKQDVCPRSRLENEQWARALAGKFYEFSWCLAGELRGVIEHKLGLSRGETFEPGRVLIIPCAGFQTIEVLVNKS